MCEICDRVKKKENFFYEDDNIVACVSKKQITFGKVSVYYKHHITSFLELNDSERNSLMKSVSKVAKIINEKLKPEHLNFCLLGNYYKHLHWHIIPRYLDNKKDKFYFKTGLEPCHMGREVAGRYDISNEEINKIVRKLKN